MRDLVGDVVDTSVPEPMGAYVFGPDEDGSEICRHVERAVFLEAFGNTAELLEREYGPYEGTSVFLCVVDHRRRVPAGAVRLILPSPGGPGLKSLNDLAPVWGEVAPVMLARAGVAAPPDATWDVATLAVMPEYRGAAAAGLVSIALYQSGVRGARRVGVDWMVAILDAAVHRMQRLAFRGPFVAFAPGRSYLGSTSSFPVSLHIPEWERRILASDQAIHDIMFDARGIEAAMRPLDLDHIEDLVRRGERGSLTPDGAEPAPEIEHHVA
ncbi:MAG TPA: hypothetical protein VND23_02105 [Acidimicrobiales bacterium]|nr:hypothetical protein [Acidimicrobiales bacterium]